MEFVYLAYSQQKTQSVLVRIFSNILYWINNCHKQQHLQQEKCYDFIIIIAYYECIGVWVMELATLRYEVVKKYLKSWENPWQKKISFSTLAFPTINVWEHIYFYLAETFLKHSANDMCYLGSLMKPVFIIEISCGSSNQLEKPTAAACIKLKVGEMLMSRFEY